MKRKDIINVSITILVLLLMGGGVYYFFGAKPFSPEDVLSDTQLGRDVAKAEAERTRLEEGIVSYLKSDWQSVQALLPARPVYRDQNENSRKVWRLPISIQFVDNGTVLFRTEDDNQPYTAVLRISDRKPELLEAFKNKSQFAYSEWMDILEKYADIEYPVSTYTKSVVRNGETVRFDDYQKVSENVFLQDYFREVAFNDPAGLAAYKNQDLKLEFSYPKSDAIEESGLDYGNTAKLREIMLVPKDAGNNPQRPVYWNVAVWRQPVEEMTMIRDLIGSLNMEGQSQVEVGNKKGVQYSFTGPSQIQGGSRVYKVYVVRGGALSYAITSQACNEDRDPECRKTLSSFVFAN